MGQMLLGLAYVENFLSTHWKGDTLNFSSVSAPTHASKHN